jgi:hypothetical protein
VNRTRIGDDDHVLVGTVLGNGLAQIGASYRASHKRPWFVRVIHSDLHCPVLQIKGIKLGDQMSFEATPSGSDDDIPF